MSSNQQNKLVRAFLNPAGVVTYRVLVAAFATITLSLVSILGHQILDGITKLQSAMLEVQLSVSRASGRIDGQDVRLGRVERSVDVLIEKDSNMDHRVTVLETKRP